MKPRTNFTGVLTIVAFAWAAVPTLWPQSAADWGKALLLDGSGDRVEVPGIVLTNTSMTIEAWAKRETSGTWDGLVGQGWPAAGTGLFFSLRDNDVFVFSYWDGGIYSPGTYTDADWHHWAATHNLTNGLRHLYRDGQLVASDTHSTIYSGTGTLTIGDLAWGGAAFQGQIDDVRLWNVARTQAEIAQHLNHPLTGGEPGLLAYWRFDEDGGAAAENAVPLGRNGELVGDAVRVSSTIPLWSYAVSLHGGEDRVEADAVTGFPSTNVTVELWMRGLDPLAPGTPFSYATALNDHTFVLRNFGEFELYVAGESAGPTGFLLPDSQWHHIAATWRHHDGECRLYLDGQLAHITQVAAGANLPSAGTLVLGQEQVLAGEAFDPSQAFVGELDEVRIWDTVRSEGEIQSTLAQRLTGTEPHLVAYWRFDQGLGLTATDATTNGYEGTLLMNAAWTLSSLPPGPPPVLSEIADQTVPYGWPIGSLPFTIDGPAATDPDWVLTAGSDNEALISNDEWMLPIVGEGRYRSLAVLPNPDQCGTAVITVTATNAKWFQSASQSFPVTVACPPSISQIASQTLAFGASSGLIPFTISDSDTPLGSLAVAAFSDNPTLVPNTSAALRLGGTEGTRTIEVVPAAGQCGSANVTIEVGDQAQHIYGFFTITIQCPPALSAIPDRTTPSGTPVGPLWFSVSDPDSQAGDVTVAASSDNDSLVPNTASALRVEGAGSNRSLVIVPETGRCGTAHITLTADDGVQTGSTTFALTVNCAPLLTSLPDRTILQGDTTGPIPFTATDPDTSGPNLQIQLSSDNPVLVPQRAETMILGGGGSMWTLEIAPDPLYSGQAHITVTVGDGIETVSDTFLLTVVAQPSLTLSGLSPPGPASTQVEFWDSGTGATNYALEYRMDLSQATSWATLTNATVTPTGQGFFRATVQQPDAVSGFYRVTAHPSALANVTFASGGQQVSETNTLLNLTLFFNQPFIGTLHYAVGATDPTLREGLTGSISVAGSTATIPIVLSDDALIGPLRYLTLSLQPGTGYTIGAFNQYTLTVEENDADWQGSLLFSNALWNATTVPVEGTNLPVELNPRAAIDFVLRVSAANGTLRAGLRGDGYSYFSSNEVPAAIVFTSDTFVAAAESIPAPAVEALFGAGASLSLMLTAQQGTPGQLVTGNHVQGAAEMVYLLPDRPHLNTTNLGNFDLRRPAVRAATNEVELISSVQAREEPRR